MVSFILVKFSIISGDNMDLLVIFGGCSSEYEVSLHSSASVLRNIPEKYNVTKLGITKDGRWYFYDGDIDSIENDTWCVEGKAIPAVLSPDRNDKSLIVMRNNTFEKIKIDVVFPVLHGKNGEDGTIQGIFELAGIPYVGCGVLSSSMCMDKAVTNTICDYAGITQAKWASFTKNEYYNGEINLDKIIEKLQFPIFVKPANAGSSVGITKAHDKDELLKAVDLAFVHDNKAVLEECIVGRELECAVMGNGSPVASCVGEILPEAEFYDYDAKYNDGTTGLSIPAKLPDGIEEKIKKAAIKTYTALGCTGLSRVDFFLKEDGTVCLNELNTLPGFTSISMFPKLFAQEGIAYGDLIDRLICYALERNEK